MRIKYENADELKQILDILLGLGYNFHGNHGHKDDRYSTSEKIMREWNPDNYSVVMVTNYHANKPDSVCLIGGDGLSWTDDTSIILGSLKNFKTFKNKITIEGVGDYSAIVKKDRVTVGCQKISHEKVKEIYEAILKFEK